MGMPGKVKAWSNHSVKHSLKATVGHNSAALQRILIVGLFLQQWNVPACFQTGLEEGATMEDVYLASVETDRGVKEQLRLYDTRGLQEGVELPKHYFSVADGFVLVYAVTSLEAFQRVELLKKEIDVFRDKKEVNAWLAKCCVSDRKLRSQSPAFVSVNVVYKGKWMHPQPWATQQKGGLLMPGKPNSHAMQVMQKNVFSFFFLSLFPLLQLKFSQLNAPARTLMTNKTYGLQQCSSYVFLDIVQGKSNA